VPSPTVLSEPAAYVVAGGSVDAAVRHAAAAAAAAGVRISVAREPSELRAVARLLAQVWDTAPGQDPLAADVLRGLTHAGGAVHVAYQGPRPVGASAVIFSSPASGEVYSLIAAANSSDRGVGYALKHAQRAWSLNHGATSMAWTFDPLLSRNARFNLVKLGAVAREYVVDFYGPLDDAVNGGDETDRLGVIWRLTTGRTADAVAGRASEVVGPDWSIAERGPAEAPDGGVLTACDEGGLWCRVPADIVAVRGQDPTLAARWRTAVRGVFLAAVADGLIATGMTRDGWYRLTRAVPA
jgi:predicted GNAT superfamily acetyltransferase